MGYQRNWTVQKGTELAAGVEQARRQFLEAEYRYVYATSSDIAQNHRTSRIAPLRPGLFVSKADAEAETTRLLQFYALGRRLYRFTVKTALFSVELGQTVRLRYPRWNLNNGRNCVVIAVADSAGRRETELRAFG